MSLKSPSCLSRKLSRKSEFSNFVIVWSIVHSCREREGTAVVTVVEARCVGVDCTDVEVDLCVTSVVADEVVCTDAVSKLIEK